MLRNLFVTIALLAAAAPASAQIDARMFRQPAVSADKIAFVYAGDIWLVPKTGGTAIRLSSPLGEENVPAFLARRHQARLQRRLRRQHRRVRRPGGRRRAGAAHAPSDAGPCRRLASRRQARAVCVGAARADASATTSSISSASTAACPRSCRCRTASSARSRPTARASSTCRCRRTSATGSDIAAAGRRTCCSSI